MKIEKVLVCTDFSKPASLLLDCLPEMKAKGLKEVVLIHVVNIRSAGGNAATLQKFNQDEIQELVEPLEKEGLQVKTRVPIGFPPHEIVEAALEENVSLILLGSIGKGIIRRIFMGSTAFDVIRISKSPVLIERFTDLRSGEFEAVCQLKFQKVLLPIDFSKDSLDVLNNIGEMLQGQGELVLVSVLEGSESKEALKEMKRQAEENLSGFKKEWEESGLEVSYFIREGNASTGILNVAKDEGATMIAMAKRGTGKIRELLIGSTAEAVALRSPIPVLLFPSKVHHT